MLASDWFFLIQKSLETRKNRHDLTTETGTIDHDVMIRRLNQIIEIMLRAYVSPLQDDWSDHIPILDLAYNSAKNVSTGFAPVQRIYTQPQDILERILSPDTIHPGNLK